jgi:antitoxin component YwqK of YwqJK toxin-antitoxin module
MRGNAPDCRESGQKEAEGNHKDGKADGFLVSWHENGQKMMESTFKDNELISGKFWNSKGEEVDSLEEAAPRQRHQPRG